MSSRLLIPPAVEPITLAEAKSHVQIVATDQDGNLERAIAAARSTVETYCERALITSTWRLNAPIDERARALGYLELAPSPARSIVTVSVIDPELEPAPVRRARIPAPLRALDGRPRLGPVIPNVRALTVDEYAVDLDVEPARLWLAEWPTTIGARVAVTFTAGYGDTGAAVPPSLIQTMLQLVGLYFEFREDVTTGVRLEALPGGHAALEALGPFRVLALA